MQFFAAACISLLTAGLSYGQNPSASVDRLAGAPIVAARQAAIDDRPFHRTLDADKMRQWMDISSRCTIAEFELFLAPLTPAEQSRMRPRDSGNPSTRRRINGAVRVRWVPA